MNPAPYTPELSRVLEGVRAGYAVRDNDAVMSGLRRAVDLAPHRLDLRLAVANRHIQTDDPRAALGVWDETATLFPDDPTVLTYQAHWRRWADDLSGCGRAFEALARVQPDRARALAGLWGRIDDALATPLSTAVPEPASRSRPPAVVILGFLLNDDGTASQTLVERLQTGLAVAARYPDAPVIVSGGMPKNGRVEADVMADWLVRAGMEPSRIRHEGYSRDLVENVLYSRDVLVLLQAEAVLVVTSAHDVRRAVVCFETVGALSGRPWPTQGVAAGNGVITDDGADAMKVYRDSLRVFGLPLMAVYPEMAIR
ncbi:MAG: YdcF family protein [Planctomycetes bacterium]|nr:YdcF family protein [Planctomycetota bacterium]MCC8117084.1 YdcF family protein [Planctomycetota bacterium]MCD7897892.1 YdcF family protein [Planctomycetaceae bacterium]